MNQVSMSLLFAASDAQLQVSLSFFPLAEPRFVEGKGTLDLEEGIGIPHRMEIRGSWICRRNGWKRV
jgi:hypothetical protein